MMTRAQAVENMSPLPRCPVCGTPSERDAPSCHSDQAAQTYLAEAPFITTAVVEDTELHRVSFAPIHVHDGLHSWRSPAASASTPPDITFTPDDSELHPIAVAMPPLTLGLRNLLGRPTSSSLVGQIIADKYRVLDQVGRGGTGIVYKVEDVETGNVFALKAVANDPELRPHAVSQLRQEAKATALLTHEHTVRVVDSGETTQHVYLVMEYLRGHDLATLLRRQGAMPEARVVQLAIQVCQSVAEAHQHGIIHRDIKPENVFLLQTDALRDFVKVVDFGVAHLDAADDALAQSKAVYGTPNYMAPEQIRGERVDARCDVYSLAALIYKAITGVAPFSAETPAAVLEKHLHEQPRKMRECADALVVSEQLEAIVARALSKDPAHRQASMQELAQELTASLAVDTTVQLTSAVAATAATPRKSEPKRNKKAKKQAKKKKAAGKKK
jgi:serine/threonine protein kinase